MGTREILTGAVVLGAMVISFAAVNSRSGASVATPAAPVAGESESIAPSAASPSATAAPAPDLPESQSTPSSGESVRPTGTLPVGTNPHCPSTRGFAY